MPDIEPPSPPQPPALQFSMRTLLVAVAVAPLVLAQAVWCGTSGFVTSFGGQVLAGVLSPVILAGAILVVLRVTYGSRRSMTRGWVHTSLMALAWWLLAAALLGVCVLIGMAIPLRVTLSNLAQVIAIRAVAGAALLSAVVLMLAWLFDRHWSARQGSLLWMLVVATQNRMPLASALAAFADDWPGRFGRRANRLADLVGRGLALPEALERLPGLLPQSEMFAVWVGHEIGALDAALRDAAQTRTYRQPLWQAVLVRLAYLVVVLLALQAICVWMMLFIAPKFQLIFDSFDTRTPALTEWVISTADWVGANPLAMVFLVAEAVLIPALFAAQLLHYSGWIRWGLPFATRLDAAQLLRALSLAVLRRQSPGAVMSAFARKYPKAGVRRRLTEVQQDLDRGADWCDSLRRHGLIRPAEAAVFEAAQRVGNLPWALREMADSLERRLAYRLRAWLSVLFPVALVALGGVIAVFVISFFLPMVRILSELP